ncbi:uncharacterized protein N7498_000741 [Penicillium cinerascens]|uniref:Uncharacterized protein n=1 Tax=Penicillium cinerascens TaxID=70096 RepID=A0A9W9TDC6_9EURO|nr:uncharacterized protein N7498_000741 [Penicillium cinerascens]KAJ5218642.1 hypothetical protein N7498_000741 [Penicillium cinerascens]
MTGGDWAMTVNIERGAARISIHDSGSPTRVARERTPTRHQMTLRSHSGQDSSPFRWFLADSLRLLPSSMNENESEATTEILSTSQIQEWFPEPPSPARDLNDPQGPFLSLPTTPEHNGPRVWAFHNPVEPDFAIWEDPTYRPSPLQHTPLAYHDAGEEKENIFATVSDYDTSDGSESGRGRIDWTRVQVGPHDVFGLPIESPFGPALVDMPVGRNAGDSFSRAHPIVTERTVRSQMRVMMHDEDEQDEWDDSLATTQIRELQELRNVFMGGAEDRYIYGRQFPVLNAQGQNNVFFEPRRITEYQDHRDRHHQPMEED